MPPESNISLEINPSKSNLNVNAHAVSELASTTKLDNMVNLFSRIQKVIYLCKDIHPKAI